MAKLDQTGGGSAKVPLVSEVLDRLLAQESGGRSRRSALFQAALQVCTEELRRVKKGATPAGLSTLVERARTLLAAPAGQVRAIPSPPPAAADLAPLLDDTAGKLSKLAKAPKPEQPAEAPPVASPATPPEPTPVPPVTEVDPFALASEEPPPVPAAAEPWPPPPPPVSFVELFPPATEVSDETGDEHATAARSGVRLFVLAAVLIAAVGAAAWYFHLLPLGSNSTAPTPAAPVAAIAQHTSAPPTAVPAPTIQPAASAPGAALAEASTTAPTSAPVATPWDLTSAPTSPPVSASAPEPTVPAPRPTRPPQRAPTRVVANVARPAADKAPASAQDRAAPMVSQDWAGRAPIYVVHFSSYHDRDKAVSDAARIAAEFRRPAYVAKVNLGAEGEWFRVVVGDFATADEAFAYRAELLARHVPDVAHVYHLTAPR